MNQKNNKINKSNIFGINYFLFYCFCLIGALQLFLLNQYDICDKLWHPLITPLFFTMILGFLLNFIGNQTLYLHKFGLGFLLCVILPSFLVYAKIIPLVVVIGINNFFNKTKISQNNVGMNFSQVFMTIATVGSILSVDKILLKKSIVKFIPLVLFSLLCSFLFVGGLGCLLKYQAPQKFISKSCFWDAIFYVCNPLTSGGTNLGINGFANGIFYEAFNKKSANFINSSQIRSILMPPLILARILAIIVGGILYNLFEKTSYSGSRNLVIAKQDRPYKDSLINQKKAKPKDKHPNLGIGLLIIFALYNASSIIDHLLTKFLNFAIDPIVYLIIIVIIIKILDLLSCRYQNCVIHSSQLVITNFTPAALVCLGFSMDFIQLKDCIFDYKILIMVIFSLLTATLVAFILAKKFGFYSLEAALTAGLCSHSVGGMGNIGIMTISHRINLLHFAHIATRIVGPIVFVVLNIGFRLLYMS